MRRMWEDTEISLSQVFKEYKDAVDEVEAAVDRNPQEAPVFLRVADGARRAWEDAREDLNTFKMDMRAKIPQPGPEIAESESRSNLWTLGADYVNEYRTQSRKLERKMLRARSNIEETRRDHSHHPGRGGESR